MTKSQYLKAGRTARNKIFGSIAPMRRFGSAAAPRHTNGAPIPIQMLVSEKFTISNSRLAVIVLGIFTLAIGIILSSIPWLDYIIMKNLKLLNGTLSYHYWHKPGVLRLTKVFIFNVTNPDGFLNRGEKPRFVEFGPFVYREEMEKVNTAFHENGTTSFQHYKILKFVPEMSLAGANEMKFTIPNIPLLSLTTMTNNLPPLVNSFPLSWLLYGTQPFKSITFQEFVSGYDDTLIRIANYILPKGKRPPSKMGILLTRNGTLDDKASVFNGEKGWKNFGYMDRLNGLDHLPYWEPPCNSIAASEGSLFPPRSITKSDIVYIYDKDLCRPWTMQYRYETEKKGISCGYYTAADDMFTPEEFGNATCFCDGFQCPPRGLQSISPCQFGAPLYTSFPHFFKADPALLDAVEGLSPKKEIHETFAMINSKLGVPLEAKIRVQLNLMVEKSNVHSVSKFPSITYPIMWLEEGVEELSEELQILVYLSTTFADNIVPYITYGMAASGGLILLIVFVRTYKNYIFTKQSIELGRRTLRRGSSFFSSGQNKLMMLKESYTLLSPPLPETETEQESST